MNDIDFIHYFDWAATAPSDEDILRESLDASFGSFANPSSEHVEGKFARRAFEGARQRAAAAMGVKPEQIFFTSGGTESDQIALLSMLTRPERGRILISSIEHPAMREQAAKLKKLGFEVVSIPADKEGFIKPSSVVKKLTSDTMLVSVMAVNNETGCVQDIEGIAKAIAENSKGRKPFFHCDCVQAAGKIPFDFEKSGVDSAALSAHKIGGPRGSGILFVKKPASFTPFLLGGGQESGIRSGTENLFAAIAFSKCLEKYWLSPMNPHSEKMLENQKALTKNFIEKVKEIKGCSIVPPTRDGSEDESKFSPWVLQVAFEGIPGQVMARALDEKGFCISTGSACSAKKQGRPVLAAMHTPKDIQESAVRFSFGRFTTEEGMRDLLKALGEVTKDFN